MLIFFFCISAKYLLCVSVYVVLMYEIFDETYKGTVVEYVDLNSLDSITVYSCVSPRNWKLVADMILVNVSVFAAAESFASC